MRLLFLPAFQKAYNKATYDVKKAFEKQGRFLLKDLRHPSLHAKRYGGTEDLWQARVNKEWRFWFQIYPSFYEMVYIGKHPKGSK